MHADRQQGLRGALANAAAAVLFAAAVNGLVSAFGWIRDDEGLREPAFAPPGWSIGVVWLGLFALMGLARWTAVRQGSAGRSAARWVVGLIVLCALYPFYTGGFQLWPGMVGNVVSLLAAIVVAWRVRRVAPGGALLLLPVVGWTAFACLLTGTKIALNT